MGILHSKKANEEHGTFIFDRTENDQTQKPWSTSNACRYKKKKKERKKVNVFLLAVRGFLNMINCETKIGTLWVIEKSNIIKPKMQNVQIRRTYRGHDRLLFCQSVYNYIGSHLNKDRERALLHSHSNVHTADPLQRQGS